ncbi:MAG: hypothetical protein E7019_05365 [Alphaproteobacteria bacterium]|nr:hypothetical protein [Alphaproteobacteria bacterium]
MGYLSQKKRLSREAFLLMFSLYATGIYTILSLFFKVGFFRDSLFHVYLLELILLLYSLSLKKVLHAGFFAFFALIGYFQISSAAPIFFHNKLDSSQTVSLIYDFEKIMLTDKKFDTIEGSLIVDNQKSFPFLQVLADINQPIIISVELDKVSAKKRIEELKALTNFIREQDVPTIVIGDFGVPAWSAEMRRFMENTGLSVKNSLVFSKKGCKFCYLSSPRFYVLGFNNVGINKLKVNDSISQIKILLGIKSI